MLFSLTVGKVDAGVAVLLTEDKRLIEFPSILLPSSISSGSIVDITVSRNTSSEQDAAQRFARLQSDIYETYGMHSPAAPALRCRNATQTSVVLEWDPIELATADLRSLALYRDGSRVTTIARPLEATCTKISGLAIDTAYTFQLVLRTSAGAYYSERLPVRTHKMTDLSGISVTPGMLPAPLRESLARAVERIGAKMADKVRIDTTHFVCTEGRGAEWERAVEMNIPVVRPEWVEGCEREGRIVGVRGYYLNADPRLRQVGQGVGVQSPPQQQVQPQQQQQQHSSQAQTSASVKSPTGSVKSPTGSRPPAPPEKDEKHRRTDSKSSPERREVSEERGKAESASEGEDEKRVSAESGRESKDLPYRSASDTAGGRRSPVSEESKPDAKEDDEEEGESYEDVQL